MTRGTWSDDRVEAIIGVFLRTGVMSAAAIVAIGGLLYLARHGFEPIHYRTFQGAPPELRGVTGILRGAVSFDRRGIIQLGLLVLIATPVARVAFAVVGFAFEKDRTYMIISLIVLGILLFSLAGGAPGA
jgi:uncharacterized membrane protein